MMRLRIGNRHFSFRWLDEDQVWHGERGDQDDRRIERLLNVFTRAARGAAILDGGYVPNQEYAIGMHVARLSGFEVAEFVSEGMPAMPGPGEELVF